MFEKEAKDYTSILLKDVNCNIGNPRARRISSIDVEEAFQKAAEFGYNKAKEEMNEIGLALQSDMDKTIEQNIALKEQIEKMKADYDKLLDEKIELEDRLAESRECY